MIKTPHSFVRKGLMGKTPIHFQLHVEAKFEDKSTSVKNYMTPNDDMGV